MAVVPRRSNAMIGEISNPNKTSRRDSQVQNHHRDNSATRHCCIKQNILRKITLDPFPSFQQHRTIYFPPEQLAQYHTGFVSYQISPYGLVSTSVCNGTTFYHYYDNKVLSKTCDHTRHNEFQQGRSRNPAKKNLGKHKVRTNHTDSSELNPTSATNIVASPCSSFTPILSDSSRCSSPFLLSTHSSTRDSGLVSTESLDEDFSLFHPNKSNGENSDELIQTIRKAAEEVLCDQNLSKDSYLFRQMKRNPEGFVSIKLLACAKRIKKLIKCNPDLLLTALKCSDRLQVNNSNSKVKRLSPLPDRFTTHKKPSSLLLINPKNIHEIDDATKTLKIFGEISQVRIMRPGKSLPFYLKAYSDVLPRLEKVLCVSVEFENEASVFAAYKNLMLDENVGTVAILGPKVKFSGMASGDDSSSGNETKNDRFKQISEGTLNTKTAVSRHHSGDSSHSEDSGFCSDQINKTEIKS